VTYSQFFFGPGVAQHYIWNCGKNMTIMHGIHTLVAWMVQTETCAFIQKLGLRKKIRMHEKPDIYICIIDKGIKQASYPLEYIHIASVANYV
jgi:hypothetical protein